MVGAAETARLIGLRWEILDKLYDGKFSVTELSKVLPMKIQQISRELGELEENGLVRYVQKSERRKEFSLTENTKRLMACFKYIYSRRVEKKPDKWGVSVFLSTLGDASLSDELRISYSDTLYRVCKEYPLEDLVWVRELLESVASEPGKDLVTLKIRRSLNAILPRASSPEDKDWRKWAFEIIYPKILGYFEDVNADEEVRLWSIRTLGELAVADMDGFKSGEIEKKFLDMWFSPDVDPSGKLGQEVKEQLKGLNLKRLVESVGGKLKDDDENVRGKAEVLLGELRDYLLIGFKARDLSVGRPKKYKRVDT